MASKCPLDAPGDISANLQAERFSYFGSHLATLAYGAMVMLYVQLAGVLIARPKRGITFWAVVAYSVIIFPPATLAIGPPDYMSVTYHSLTLAFNIYATLMISLRLRMLRPRLEEVAGKLHASFYTSTITTFVESGGFFTIWIMAYLIVRSQSSLNQNLLFFPLPLIQGVTRMLIVLRVAQDRAWSRDLVKSIHRGTLDWQVATTQSIPLHDVPSISDFSHDHDMANKPSQKF
ncbi:hypothetical protein DXG01_010816 [Tephrocybe rancida]|nr:hypothetical protein DXG01_010816 [Tephrocybe rancida]